MNELNVKILKLFKDIIKFELNNTKNNDETIEIFSFESLVEHGNLEPKDLDFATNQKKCTKIPKGNYIFAQVNKKLTLDNNGLIELSKDGFLLSTIKELWLESIWQDISFKSNNWYIRIVEEDGNSSFQAYREIYI